MSEYIKYDELYDLIMHEFEEQWNEIFRTTGRTAAYDFLTILDKCKSYEFEDDGDSNGDSAE